MPDEIHERLGSIGPGLRRHERFRERCLLSFFYAPAPFRSRIFTHPTPYLACRAQWPVPAGSA